MAVSLDGRFRVSHCTAAFLAGAKSRSKSMHGQSTYRLYFIQLANTLVNKRKLNGQSNLTGWNLLKDAKQTSMAATQREDASAVSAQGTQLGKEKRHQEGAKIKHGVTDCSSR
ncbi:hypothetical protein Anapl_09452 [Anas platyrhynchos]|uniref:Uncharacterized protein n=1 Tax=Anas platyrhynchos TaxID=8839 RepID=R0KWA6_ANAPL|nr:hypothetical protein Anapl_09452 [Anas platyrhynchos]